MIRFAAVFAILTLIAGSSISYAADKPAVNVRLAMEARPVRTATEADAASQTAVERKRRTQQAVDVNFKPKTDVEIENENDEVRRWHGKYR